MSDAIDRDEPDADLAAEYALGVLDGSDRRAAERRMRQDGAFAADVERWQARFAPLAWSVPAVEPSAGVWPRINTDLDRILRVQDRARDPSLPRRAGVSPFWRVLAIASSVLAVASLGAVALLAPQFLEPTGAVYTARIAAEDGQTYFTAVVDTNTHTLTLVPADVPGDPRVPQLWLIEEGGAPQSLGLLDRSQAFRVQLETAPAGTTSTFAVSLEPEGGSPTGAPTGPVVATGTLNGV